MVMVMMIPTIVVIVIAVRAVTMVMMPLTVMVIRSSVPDRLACRQWVKLRRTQHEHMSSGLPLKADIFGAAPYGRMRLIYTVLKTGALA